jgi:hypothetical protein
MKTADPLETVKEEIGPSIGVSRRTVQSTAGIMQYKEQINPDGSFTVESMTPLMGGHKVTFDATQIKIDTTLAGINSITINATGITVQSSATINLLANAAINLQAVEPITLQSDTAVTLISPGGIMNMAAGITSWNVTGDLLITSTGNTTINPVGALILAP